MFGLSGIKLFGGLFGLIAMGALLWAAQDRFRLADIVDQAEQCAKAAADETDTKSLAPCVDDIAAQVEAARASRQCVRALGLKDRDHALFAIRAACPSAVNAEVAARHAAEANEADARASVDTLLKGQAAAIGRAEARATDMILKGKQADAAINAAPRRADGIAVCDAACLRALTGQ